MHPCENASVTFPVSPFMLPSSKGLAMLTTASCHGLGSFAVKWVHHFESKFETAGVSYPDVRMPNVSNRRNSIWCGRFLIMPAGLALVLAASLVVIVVVDGSVPNTTITNTNSTSGLSCFTQCALTCGCPIGANGQLCNSHGACVDGTCVCNPGWSTRNISSAGVCDVESVSLNYSTYLFVLIVSCICGLVAYNASLLYLYYTDHVLVQKSRPAFVHLMNFGTIVCSASIAVAASIAATPLSCSLAWVFADLSFVVVFGTVLVRLVRTVRVLLSSSKGPPVKITDAWVCLHICCLLGLEGGLLAAIWILHGFDLDTSATWQVGESNSWEHFQGCIVHSRPAAIALIAPKGFYLFSILALAVKLRRSKKEERDMTKLAFCIGLTLVLWAMGLSLYLTATRAIGDMFYLCLVFLLLLPTTMVVFVTAYPKWIEIHRALRGYHAVVRPSLQHSRDINLYLHHVAWYDVQQVEDAERQLNLLLQQHPNGLEMGTLLMLLSDRVRHRGIRRLATTQLATIDPTHVSLYVPQLVQALKYDLVDGDVSKSPLVLQLLRLACTSVDVAYQMYWCIVVELQNTMTVVIEDQEIAHQDRKSKPLFEAFLTLLEDALMTQSAHGHLMDGQRRLVDFVSGVYQRLETGDAKSMTAQLRVEVASSAFPALHPLYPNIWVKGFDADASWVFKSNAKPMKLQLLLDSAAQLEHITVELTSTMMTKRRSSSSSASRSSQSCFKYAVAVELVGGVVSGVTQPGSIRIDVHGHVKTRRFGADGRLEDPIVHFHVGVPPQLVELQLFLKKTALVCAGVAEVEVPMLGLPPTALQIPPTGCGVTVAVRCTEVETQDDAINKAGLERAATERLQGTVSSVSPGIIFKHGDDLRQDQLALQMLAVMDAMCTHHGLLLHFTLYRVLATSVNEGIAEFVPGSYPMSQVLRDNNYNILAFLKRHQFDVAADNNVKPQAMDIFVRSVAGYCVATYILGIGDRHLDNLMMKTTGHFFHIDFGFMFGKDPKPLPPPFRLTPEMVNAMGGLDGEDFKRCIGHATSCFNILRQNAHVLLAVLHLTKDAGIPDMRADLSQDKDVAIHEVEKRLLLRASPEKAAQFMHQLMIESQNTQTTARLSLMERLHRVAVAFK
ncbi:Aste57867_22481 [Aphanomyces stellatus]|uniref:Aste57867_22481 protein n=1 Tax=Aphanomyces stellatus TaxID=120398 RepID=A0A485LQ35_9STRA|nr:hypothetical protein As57867_022411 [Aphanomyces stellatus]VFT99141.1 Aste57867_22481 [Aphanomyces stellatus]